MRVVGLNPVDPQSGLDNDESSEPSPESQLRWYQGLEPYCWLVLIIAALGWLFDTMDQNLFNLVRAPVYPGPFELLDSRPGFSESRNQEDWRLDHGHFSGRLVGRGIHLRNPRRSTG